MAALGNVTVVSGGQLLTLRHTPRVVAISSNDTQRELGPGMVLTLVIKVRTRNPLPLPLHFHPRTVRFSHAPCLHCAMQRLMHRGCSMNCSQAQSERTLGSIIACPWFWQHSWCNPISSALFERFAQPILAMCGTRPG
jgi:hypothetical protein